jgi:uncharacterized protein
MRQKYVLSRLSQLRSPVDGAIAALCLLGTLLVGCAAPQARTAPSAVPPPPGQDAANCDSPTYASDLLVCGDPQLRALDARMLDVWSSLDLARVLAPDAWVESQQEWFKRRSLCAFNERHDDCLRGAYLERIAVLEALQRVASRPPRQGTTTVCRDAPWRQAELSLRAPVTGALTIEGRDARVVAAATQLRPEGPWQPYAAFSVDGSSVRLTPRSGAAVECSLYGGH